MSKLDQIIVLLQENNRLLKELLAEELLTTAYGRGAHVASPEASPERGTWGVTGEERRPELAVLDFPDDLESYGPYKPEGA